tara:strand:- start:1737 stop:2873 length:1137 start_codon:yes stop_codon:yes gene_type:complete
MNSITKYDYLCKKYKSSTIKCEICDGNEFTDYNKIGRISVAGSYGVLPVVICKNCSYTYQNPRYSDEFYREYYKILYREVAFGSKAPSDTYINLQEIRGKNILDYLTKKGYITGQTRILDHGCASGNTMKPFEEAKLNIRGIDPHEPSVEQGKKNGRNISLAGGEELPFDNKSLDLIVSLGSLEHVYDINQSMKEISRVLSDEGILFARWRSNKIWGSPYEFYNHNHYRFFTLNTWEFILNKFNIQLIDSSFSEIEGLTGAAYIIAKKTSKNINFKEKIENFDTKKEIKSRINYLKTKKTDASKYFKEFLDFAEVNKFDNKVIYESIHNNSKNKANYKLLFGIPEEVVPRAILEAQRYQKGFSMDKKISNNFKDYEII